MTGPAAAERHDRHRRRRPARPHVGDGRGPARLSLPHPDAGAGQPGRPGSRSAPLGDYDDPALLRDFAESVDVVTFEFENVSAAGLDLLASIRPVRPAPSILRISQDRVDEKAFLNNAGITTAPWLEIKSRAALHAAVAGRGFPEF